MPPTSPRELSLDAWRQKATNVLLLVCVLLQAPTVIIFIGGFDQSATWLRKIVALISYSSVLLCAVLRQIDYRRRLWLVVIIGYITVVMGTIAVPTGPFIRVLPIALAIFVLVLIGIPAARVATVISAVLIVVAPLLPLLPGVTALFNTPGVAAPYTIRQLIPQTLSLLALLINLMLLLEFFSRALLQALDAQQHATEAVKREMLERRRLEQEILTVGELERQRFGAEIHDGLCQQLTSGLLHAATLHSLLTKRDAAEARLAHSLCQGLEGMMGEAYGVARGLSSPEIAPQGLPAALEGLLAETQTATHLQCQLHQPAARPLDTIQESQLYRIAQEAVRNVSKHAQAQHLWMSLTEDGETITLSICDDGQGIPPDARSGLGIRSMIYRAQSLGGTLRVDCPPEGGVLVNCRIPRQRPDTGEAVG